MAAVAQSAVTIDRRWEVGDRFGKHQEVSVDATIVLSSQGGTAADIPAALFGLSSISSVRTLLFTDGSSVPRFQPTFTNGSDILTADITDTTDATRGAAANLTGTLKVRVTGRP